MASPRMHIASASTAASNSERLRRRHRATSYSYGSYDDDDLSSGNSGGCLWSSRRAHGVLRPHSYEDVLFASRRDGARGGSTDGVDDDTCVDVVKWCQMNKAPRYVSFEDMSDSDQTGHRRPPDAGNGTSGPLVRAAPRRLPARVHHPRQQRRSPGPLGTRRGGPMYRFIKKYVCPCLGFINGVFQRT